VTLFLAGLAVAVMSGFAALLAGRRARWATALGAGGAVVGCALGLAPALQVLSGAAPESLRAAWAVPYGTFFVEIDSLSAFFLLPILGFSALAAVYGAEYLFAERARRSLGAPWFFFNLLVAGMALTVVARNGVLFLVAWEVMSLASFFLVTFEHEEESVRAAGWTYLVATHLGTAFLLALFAVLGREAGSLDFDRFEALGALAPSLSGTIFLLALVGFGTKAGLMPLHVWLPEAHPAAPSHVSAVMSGLLIKTGIYGILRTLTFVGAPAPWWGWLLIAVGLIGAVVGILFALSQRDLKRLLAYSSIENMGIVALGIGLGLLGESAGSRSLAVLGFGGALLHVLNHTVFKGLLFLGAGAVLHATGTRAMDRLGGLLKRMPWTGAAFLVGALAITGLPPLNGFVSEFLLYLGAFYGKASLGVTTGIPLMGVVAGLALLGGLAAACFTKAFGIVFLGEPRSESAALGREPGLAMRAPVLILAAGCLALALFSPALLGLLAPVLEQVTRQGGPATAAVLDDAAASLVVFVGAGAGVLALIVALAFLRRSLLARRPVGEGPTWDCGYARPSPRMQYTASSYAQPLTSLFQPLLRTRRQASPPQGLFPERAALATEAPDPAREYLYRPAFAGVGRALAALRWLQHGRVHLYVLYIALTLVVLLLWKLG
jgi:formate hydrogenlyase subunit 3/multisubunit Na+/H+ antiporter MnhD subunit